MKLLLLAGEESGVLYARGILDAFRARQSARGESVEVRGYEDYGFRVSDLAVMGFWAVLKKLFYFLRVKRTMERAIDEWHPDVVCTVDYPGMNLKLAAYAKQRGIRAVHVVCPQVWAWRQGRIPKIEAALDKLCCFFPFEPSYFRPGFAEFIGHPLVDSFGDAGKARDVDAGRGKVVALLPGSRTGEIEKHLPRMLEAVKGIDAKIIIPAANPKARALIDETVRRQATGSVDVVNGGAREVLKSSTCAVVASGTATLEAALARCPTVLVYDIGWLMGEILRHLIKGIHYVGLANIIWEKGGRAEAGGLAPMPELLQNDFTAANVRVYLDRWLGSADEYARAVERLDAAMQLLVSDGSAFSRIAAAL